MASFRTPFCGYSVEFSPFEESKLAVATAQYFGVVGNGQLHVLQYVGHALQPLYVADTQDGVYDLAWSEGNEHQIFASSGDGSVKLFDLAYPQPLQVFAEHTAEVYGVDCNYQQHNLFSSASYDNTVKVWDANVPQSIATYTEHTYCVYEAQWSPKDPNMLMSASGDCTIKLWDIRSPGSVGTASAHANEVLSCDWDKYNEGFATASVDQSVALWDLRQMERPYTFLTGHTYAIRRVRYSPYDSNILASASYDMTICVWNALTGSPPIHRHQHHTEFCIGVDFSIFNDKLIASCGWDGRVSVWEFDQPAPI